MNLDSELTIRSLDVRAVNVPLQRPLKTGGGEVRSAAMVLVDVLIRDSVGEEVVLMSDYNQSLSVAEARRRAAALEDEGLYWIEEPTCADDYSGYTQVRRGTKTPIQIGENWWGRTTWLRASRRALPTT